MPSNTKPLPAEPAIPPPSPSPSILSRLRAWGESPVPPTGLAALISALHTSASIRHDRTEYVAGATRAGWGMRFLKSVPIFILVPTLLGSSYLNLAGLKKDSAGLTAAASMSYVAMAMRRKQTLRNKFSVRGAVRGSALALCAVNAASGMLILVTGTSDEFELD